MRGLQALEGLGAGSPAGDYWSHGKLGSIGSTTCSTSRSFHSLAKAEGLKVVGSLDVGLRLREDCSNIRTAFEWVADHERWTLAGELLSASQCTYHLSGRSIDAVRALVRTADHTAELDPELHGCVLVQTVYSAILLTDFTLLWAVSDLRRSPLPEFRWPLVAGITRPRRARALLSPSCALPGQQV